MGNAIILMVKLVSLGTGSGGFVGSERQNPVVYFDGVLFDSGPVPTCVKRLSPVHLNNRSGPADEIGSEAKEVFKNSIVVNDFDSFEI